MKTSALFIAASIAAAITGILSGIPWLGCLFCFWMMVGGFVAIPLYKAFDKEKHELTPGQGVGLGALTGAMAAILASLIGLIFSSMSANQILDFIRADPGLSQTIQGIPDVVFTGAAGFLGLLCNLIFYPIFGLLGGLIGAAVFRK